MSGATLEITNDNIESTIGSSEILFLDFWASWCGPCRAFAPTFEAAAAKHPDLAFGKIDTEANQQLAAALQITSIPTLMAFRDGILVFREPGALPPPAFDDLIQAVRDMDMDEARRKLAEQQAGS